MGLILLPLGAFFCVAAGVMVTVIASSAIVRLKPDAAILKAVATMIGFAFGMCVALLSLFDGTSGSAAIGFFLYGMDWIGVTFFGGILMIVVAMVVKCAIRSGS